MERAVFRVSLEETPWSPSGTDAVQFLVSANAGEDPRPMEKIASGGELSRIALAVKTCVTGETQGRTLVFDEVDAGIGGAAAESVGRRLKALAARRPGSMCNSSGSDRGIRRLPFRCGKTRIAVAELRRPFGNLKGRRAHAKSVECCPAALHRKL